MTESYTPTHAAVNHTEAGSAEGGMVKRPAPDPIDTGLRIEGGMVKSVAQHINLHRLKLKSAKSVEGGMVKGIARRIKINSLEP
jgi:hypothetical protein